MSIVIAAIALALVLLFPFALDSFIERKNKNNELLWAANLDAHEAQWEYDIVNHPELFEIITIVDDERVCNVKVRKAV